jgi:hypothetical protein
MNMNTSKTLKHVVVGALLIGTVACGSKHDRDSDGQPSVGKSVGGDSAANVERSHPIRNIDGDQNIQQDSLR